MPAPAIPIPAPAPPTAREAALRSTLWSGVYGAAGVAVGVVAGHLAGTAFVPAYRNINFRLKTFVGSSMVVAGFWVTAEIAHENRILADGFGKRDDE